MGYRYGHPTTSWSGIYQWLVGFSGKDNINYIPKNGLDLNQRTRFAENIVLAYFKHTNREVVGKWRRKEYQLYRTVQSEFQQFAKFVKDNYEPQ